LKQDKGNLGYASLLRWLSLWWLLVVRSTTFTKLCGAETQLPADEGKRIAVEQRESRGPQRFGKTRAAIPAGAPRFKLRTHAVQIR
jgi:hypothetical protein